MGSKGLGEVGGKHSCLCLQDTKMTWEDKVD